MEACHPSEYAGAHGGRQRRGSPGLGKNKPILLAVFWSNSGAINSNAFNFETKLSLLLRSVYSAINWKFSRWPFQKSIAFDMDKLQVNMVSILSRIPRANSENIASWLRRRGQAARNVCSRMGFWSESWPSGV